MSALEEVAALVERASGIMIRGPQRDALASALKRVDPELAPEAFVRRARGTPEGRALLARLLDELTVKETFFLREALQLEQIPWQTLLDAARSRGTGPIRIWSAGCATGEEAYTLALLACEADGSDAPPVRILATDISQRALERALVGAYRPRSTRELEPTLRQRYFREEGDRLVVGEHLRSLVTFAPHNLVADPAPPLGEAPFDLILCRNVLIYFDAATAALVAAALNDALAPSGTLILGSADALLRGAGGLRELGAGLAHHPGPPARGEHALRRPPDEERGGGPIPLGPPRPPALIEAAGPSSGESLSPTFDILDGSAHYLQGLAALEAGDAAAAVLALRRALYTDPRFGVAAFQLGRAYESLGNPAAARRAYEQALRTCQADPELDGPLLAQVELGDVVAAVRARLDALGGVAEAPAPVERDAIRSRLSR